MKTLIKHILVFSGMLCLLFSCQPDGADIKTGIIAKVYSGSGDCMPIVDLSKRAYTPYSGKLYIVKKLEYDKSGATLESLKSKSIGLNIRNGELAVALKPDSFVVFIDDGYNPSTSNVIYLKENDLLKTPFYFFHCTSY